MAVGVVVSAGAALPSFVAVTVGRPTTPMTCIAGDAKGTDGDGAADVIGGGWAVPGGENEPGGGT